MDSPSPASPPFDQPSADIVLRSSDGVDFHVHSQILAQASPFFATMFSLPQPLKRSACSPASDIPAGANAQRGTDAQLEVDARSGTDAQDASPPSAPSPAPLLVSDPAPVIDVSEDSVTLDMLLRILYPIPKSTLDDPASIVTTIKAAQKYEMEWPAQFLSQQLSDIIRTPRVAVQAWAAACRAGLEDVARQAALALRVSELQQREGIEATAAGTPAALACVQELGKMEGISGGDYFRLKRFLRAEQARVDDGSLKLLTPLPADVWSVGQMPIPAMPFTTDTPFPDVVCRSAPHEERVAVYPAHLSVLSSHCPALKQHLAERSRSDPEPSQLQLNFDTDPLTLRTLLNLCYGNDVLPLCNADMIARVILAAEKSAFQMIAFRAHEYWERVARSKPLSAYLAAAAHGLPSKAQAAAKLAIRRNCAADCYDEELERTSALAYHRLLQYNDSCRQLMQDSVVAAANRLSDCDITVQVRSKSTVLNTTGVRDALQRPDVLGSRLLYGMELRRALRKTLSNALNEKIGVLGWEGELCNFIDAAFDILVDLPDRIGKDTDLLKLDFE
ncbi:hypothetical protein PYCCODRAFT_1465386 [Trametes coccinea BRFM310]|uniref:BTB domain-containing protein n=1 Tax=Trametes coccinea (strain BRFM310) TaxID=1353009 RepID=A0A1Y2IZX1_TRAC3|nr:hypothetical protein PYCCODRAFT_1465386 [Trametes coccinea BRFM310]